jgi:hypothetical protein
MEKSHDYKINVYKQELDNAIFTIKLKDDKIKDLEGVI